LIFFGDSAAFDSVVSNVAAQPHNLCSVDNTHPTGTDLLEAIGFPTCDELTPRWVALTMPPTIET
jgi:hypothetical protein